MTEQENTVSTIYRPIKEELSWRIDAHVGLTHMEQRFDTLKEAIKAGRAAQLKWPDGKITLMRYGKYSYSEDLFKRYVPPIGK